MPAAPMGKGLTLVIVGGVAGLIVVSENVFPPLPVALVAVTGKEVVAAALGVPVNKPPEESEAHPGKPVALQVIGVVPVALN